LITAALAIAAAIGCASSLLPGPCNLAIVEGALAGARPSRLVSTALGGALGDLGYATVAAAGVGAVIARDPNLPAVCDVLSGIVLVVAGLGRLAPGLAVSRAVRRLHRPHGVALGLGLVLANPAVLLTWTLVVGALSDAASTATVLAALAVAIAVGSFIGFASTARVASRTARLRARDLGRHTAALGVALVALGLIALGRAAVRWVG
jgi:threonine/homoserine/homoserine lactone efflux protein